MLLQDYSEIDPSYVKGAEISMDGDDFEHFVRWRDTSETGSNDDRMKRQQEAVTGLAEVLSGYSASRLMELSDSAGNELYSDVSAELLKKIADYGFSGDIEKLPGKTVEGERHDEFYVDESAIKEFIIKNYYKKLNQ